MIWDYLVFLIFIVATTFVAVYNRQGPKEKTKADYVFATGSVSMAAMMLSIARGTLGVRSFLGELWFSVVLTIIAFLCQGCTGEVYWEIFVCFLFVKMLQ